MGRPWLPLLAVLLPSACAFSASMPPHPYDGPWEPPPPVPSAPIDGAVYVLGAPAASSSSPPPEPPLYVFPHPSGSSYVFPPEAYLLARPRSTSLRDPGKPAPTPEPAADTAHTETARALAGTVEKSSSVGHEEPLRRHARRAAADFEQFEKNTGKAMSEWARKNLAAASGTTVFYPFAGPDLVTVHRFYPDAGRYVLVALQDGGAPPELKGLSQDELSRTFAVYGKIFDGFAKRGFFITAQMGPGYRTPRAAQGISGVLMALAEREGFQVVDVIPIRVKADGSEVEEHPGDRNAAATWASVRLDLRRRSDSSRVLVDYLKIDLSDGWLKRDDASHKFLRRASQGPTLMKAASHLPQQAGFGVIRDLVLNGATQLVQDETGVAYKLLEKSFDVRLYGSFRAVNTLFDGRPQQALRQAYATRKDIEALPFSIGYRKAGGSALMVATRSAPRAP